MKSPAIQPQPGTGALSVNLIAGQSAVTEAWCFSPLKLLVPRLRGASVWVYLSSFGGGLVAGDQTQITLRLGQGASCFFTTQASTKIYRNPNGRPCSHQFHAVLGKDSLLVVAPDPVQAFANSSYSQRQEFQIDKDAGLVLLDWFCSGRAARGERWRFECLQSRNDVYLDGKRCLLDSMLLNQAHGPLDGPYRLGRFNCVGLILLVGKRLGDEAQALLENISRQPIARRSALIYSASPLAGGTLVRVAGEQVEEVARFVNRSLKFLGRLMEGDPWSRKFHLVESDAPLPARN